MPRSLKTTKNMQEHSVCIYIEMHSQWSMIREVWIGLKIKH